MEGVCIHGGGSASGGGGGGGSASRGSTSGWGGGVQTPPPRYMGYYELILSAKYSHQLRWVFLQLLLLVHLLIRLNELADAEKKN